MLVTPDSRRRITLPAEFEPGEPLSLEAAGDGTYRLVPVVAVPKHQLWAWRRHVLEGAAEAVESYRAGNFVEGESEAGQAFLRQLEAE
ncbi:MAG: hypothetical protein U0P81_06170 [Holophagaceae bacterium]